jgi:hypothetical protein
MVRTDTSSTLKLVMSTVVFASNALTTGEPAIEQNTLETGKYTWYEYLF